MEQGIGRRGENFSVPVPPLLPNGAESIALETRKQTASENKRVLGMFLRELGERGFPLEQPLLVVLDGAKGLRSVGSANDYVIVNRYVARASQRGGATCRR